MSTGCRSSGAAWATGIRRTLLLIEQQEHLESALYAAIVALEERADLSRRMGRRMEQSGRALIAERYFGQAEETEQQARVVRDVVSKLTLV